MQLIVSIWSSHLNGGAGHDNNSPLCTLMAFVNQVPKIVGKGNCEGKKGLVEI